MAQGRVVVTGASSGIGEATARRLVAEGYEVVATARREDRLARLAAEIGCEYVAGDLTEQADVDRIVATALAGGEVTALVNNAGGAEGLDSVADADVQRWINMYEKNVLGTLRLTKGFLPSFRAKGGDVLFVVSTAGHETYPGGAGYTAAKHAELMIPQTLRLELVGEPVRIIEIAPGLVKTEEFSLNRLGDVSAAENVYRGVDEPLLAEDIADAIYWTLSRPSHVNIDSLVIRPVAQANSVLVARDDKPSTPLPTTTIAGN